MTAKQTSAERKSICFLSDFLDVGGLENVVADAVAVLKSDFDITVVTLYGISQEMRSRLGPDVRVFAQTMGHPRSVWDFCLLSLPVIGGYFFKRCIPGEYDYLIILRSGYMMSAYSKKAKKMICWNHAEKDTMYADAEKLNFARKLNRLRLKLGYRKVDATWVVADHIREQLSCAFDLSNIYTLNNPINCDRIEAQAQQFQPEVQDSDLFTFIMVGRLSEEKGHMRALRAMAKLQDEYPCRMIIVGDGYVRESLQKFTTEHGLTDRVIFAGHQTNPYPYIRCADALLLPSEKESFGVVLLEAMILKTPVVTTDTTGGDRVTAGGAYGILVNNSEDGIEQGMRKCLSEAGLQETYLQSAYQRAKEFDISV